MESRFDPKKYENEIYNFWEKKGFFKAKINKKKKPFSIILPPPNANADLHLGHAMYVYEDIMIRYHKLLGDEVLWLPGADHAGFETQFVFEKELRKKGKTRFDYNRETLYQMIWNFVMKNREKMENQLRRLGFALDWSKKKFTLDEDVVKIVYKTFKKLCDGGLVYYDQAIVNYCVNCGTSFSDLEVVYQEVEGKLWYILYPFDINDLKKGGITVATTRPETMLADVAVAVNPKDKRYRKFIGSKVFLPLVNKSIEVIADEKVDPKFGTGAVKVTPYHDPADWEIAKRQKLNKILFCQVIGFDGRMTKEAGKDFEGLTVTRAREKIIEKLKKGKFLVKEQSYYHRVGHCYKCRRVIEPLPLAQWFIKIRPLAEKAKELVKSEEIKIFPKRFKKILIWWLDHFHDWNISRQIVWGIRIPAYQCKSKVESKNLKVKKKWFVSLEKPKKCLICGNCNFEQTDDTFDTWFSSAQWPFATLITQKIFDYFYPTSVMETGYDILPWWVARMIMIGYFATGKPPFKTVFLHGLVRDKHGQKMSKSKGNVINPMEMVDRYGADALRAALIFGIKEGNDIPFYEEKVVGMRNFANKVWNIGRFIYINRQLKTQNSKLSLAPLRLAIAGRQNNNSKLKIINDLQKEFRAEKNKYFKLMESYKFSAALGLIYEFLWHRLADYYIEQLKDELKNGNIKVLKELTEVYLENLKMLHPFMPFVTEAVWQIFHEKQSILEVNF